MVMHIYHLSYMEGIGRKITAQASQAKTKDTMQKKPTEAKSPG
jgi:hypothetical protein